MAVQLSTVVVRDSEPVATTIDNEVVMLSPRAQSYFGLGTVGSEIWNAIETPRRVDDVCTGLMQEFEIDADTCQRQVLDFLNDLIDRGLARVVTEESKG
jgi:hypothetical protein